MITLTPIFPTSSLTMKTVNFVQFDLKQKNKIKRSVETNTNDTHTHKKKGITIDQVTLQRYNSITERYLFSPTYIVLIAFYFIRHE